MFYQALRWKHVDWIQLDCLKVSQETVFLTFGQLNLKNIIFPFLFFFFVLIFFFISFFFVFNLPCRSPYYEPILKYRLIKDQLVWRLRPKDRVGHMWLKWSHDSVMVKEDPRWLLVGSMTRGGITRLLRDIPSEGL